MGSAPLESRAFRTQPPHRATVVSPPPCGFEFELFFSGATAEPGLIRRLECSGERWRAALRDGERARVDGEGRRQTAALALLPRGADRRRNPVEVRDEIALEATQHALRLCAGLALAANVLPAAHADSLLRARRDGPREAVAVGGVDEEGVGEEDKQQEGRRGRPPAETASETSSAQS